jgi:hypothetical protein
MYVTTVNMIPMMISPTEADSCHGMPVRFSSASAPPEMCPGQM